VSDDEDGEDWMLELRNPHSVLAALEARSGDVMSLQLPPSGGGAAWQAARAAAEVAGVAIGRLEQRSGDHGRERGASATVVERSAVPVEELVAGGGAGRGLWLALDSLQDPQNVGAIFRLAAFFGVHGVVMGKDRAAPMSGTVYDVASGGVEAVPFAMETNLHRALVQMRDAGLWVMGSSEHAERSVYEMDTDRAWVLVVGNEEQGLRPRIQEACDELVAVRPAAGTGVTSLNVASATAVLISALSR
jgi:23S rRNA (guanosine2251-2'-O)-methyltransferase